MSVSVYDYVRAAGVEISELRDIDLFLVTVDGHACWRLNGKFVFCPLSSHMNPDRDCIVGTIKRLRAKYHAGDNTAISELVKNSGPSDDTCSAFMELLSRHYKVMLQGDIENMKVFELKHYVYVFVDKFKHVYNTYRQRVVGMPFVQLPGLGPRFMMIIHKFLDTITTKLSSVDGWTAEATEVLSLIETTKRDPKTIDKLFAKLKSFVPKFNINESMAFSCAIHGLHKFLCSIIETFENDGAELDAFMNQKRDIERPSVISVQRRPKLRPTIKKTWREKRPTRILTKLDVHLPPVCEREKILQMRKSSRIAKLNPRRSHRLKTKR